VALDGARNAGILAAQIIGTTDEGVMLRLEKFKGALERKVLDDVGQLREKGWKTT
jgi:5-(carboxyamino)imidazole ribonucleotide mutase